MGSRRLQAGRLRGIGVGVAVLIATVAGTVAPTNAMAASPVLEFAPSASAFPISFTADGGPVTAALTGFEPVVNCAGSHGEGKIIGPRATESSYVFSGCEAVGGLIENGNDCQSENAANPGEIVTGTIEADLVFIDQARREVGMLLNPGGGVYMDFECGGEPVKARGSFLSPVGPINTNATSFTASLTRSGTTQIPSGYENALGEKRQAIPEGLRGVNPPETTGVELSFTILTSAPLQVKAIPAAEIEATQRADEAAAAAAARKRQDEEAAAIAAARRHQDEEAAAIAAARERLQEEARLHRVRRSNALARCRKADSKGQRARCERRVKKKFAPQAQIVDKR